MNRLVAQNVDLIDQALGLLEDLDGDEGRTRFPAVAPHFRHCIDFYECFLRGLEGRQIDYDERQRSPAVEASPGAAAAALRRIRGLLGELPETLLEDALRVRGDVDGEDTPWSRSTVGRELLFLLGHTVHHHALIGLLLERQGAVPPRDFGMAPSTLKHKRS